MDAKQQDATTYKAKVTGRHAVTLPAKLCRTLGIENGDTVEFEVTGRQAVIRKIPVVDANDLRGIMKPYFRDWDDIVQFIEEERSSWERPWDRHEDGDPTP